MGSFVSTANLPLPPLYGNAVNQLINDIDEAQTDEMKQKLLKNFAQKFTVIPAIWGRYYW